MKTFYDFPSFRKQLLPYPPMNSYLFTILITVAMTLILEHYVQKIIDFISNLANYLHRLYNTPFHSEWEAPQPQYTGGWGSPPAGVPSWPPSPNVQTWPPPDGNVGHLTFNQWYEQNRNVLLARIMERQNLQLPAIEIEVEVEQSVHIDSIDTDEEEREAMESKRNTGNNN